MANGERLYFTIGPVQTFVAQSRRTRDLWASSYLLSHLADVAMLSIAQAGGRIILPCRERKEGTVNSESAASVQHGRWPNRFVAITDDPKGAAKSAKMAMLDTWKSISEAVWRRFVEPAANNGNDTKAIWDRQVAGFWEVSWMIASAPSPGDPDPLSLRKNWRTTSATVEPGDHCTMMGSWQELSGQIRSQSRKSHEKQDQFWQQLRSRLGRLDLGDDERLCAIAIIKRMFPLIAQETIGIDLNNAVGWLSTPYIAAIPWLKRVCRDHSAAARTYLEAVKPHRKENRWRRENASGIASLESLLQADCGEFLRLDADFLHETALTNKRDTPLDTSEREDEGVRAELGVALGNLYQQVSGRPSSFYAMLLMDGDSMGRLLSEARASSGDEGERQVTQALGQFADKVSATVSSYDGVTVYCGGDDVFAMLPVGQALLCALALSKQYRDCFAQACQSGCAEQATISAAIVYCPFRAPLREVSVTAHYLLDHVAKDQTGRDSLAVAVLKSSGIACQWSAPWYHVQENEATILDRLVERLSGSGDRPGELSSGFLFQIRERYALLTNDPLTTPGRFGLLPEGMDVHPILLAEYLRGRSKQSDEAEKRASFESARKANETVELLLKVCRRVHRTEGMDEKTLGMDGALLVRFLSGELREVGP
jgi:CRISPR-associated protein Cmr2